MQTQAAAKPVARKPETSARTPVPPSLPPAAQVTEGVPTPAAESTSPAPERTAKTRVVAQTGSRTPVSPSVPSKRKWLLWLVLGAVGVWLWWGDDLMLSLSGGADRTSPAVVTPVVEQASPADDCNANAQVAVDFMNLYIRHLNDQVEMAADPQMTVEQENYNWLKSSTLADPSLASAFAATDSPDSDPIIDGQDYPSKFRFLRCTGEPGIVQVHGDDMNMTVSVKVAQTAQGLKVVGAGRVNMPDTEQNPVPVAATAAVNTIELGNALGSDLHVTQPTTSFASNDTIYVAIGTTTSAPGVPVPSTLGVKWIRVDNGEVVFQETRDIALASGATVGMTDFKASKPNGWLAGTYEVEISLNGEVAGRQRFQVREDDAGAANAGNTVRQLPSFNCPNSAEEASRYSSDELAICGNNMLAALDVRTAEAYRAAKSHVTDEGEFKRAGLIWLAKRKACGDDIACLAQAYRARIVELSNGSGQSDAVAAPAANAYVQVEFVGRDPPAPFTFHAASNDTNRVNGSSQGIRFTGVNLPCNTYHIYVDKPAAAGGGVARDIDLCRARSFTVLPGEIYTFRNRSNSDLVSRNVRAD